ncbi:MAG: hypothetical protein ABJE95_25120 [Byssovorax sp.]
MEIAQDGRRKGRRLRPITPDSRSGFFACGHEGCHCADHPCSGGFCPGTGCTARETKDCSDKGHGCAGGKCK